MTLKLLKLIESYMMTSYDRGLSVDVFTNAGSYRRLDDRLIESKQEM